MTELPSELVNAAAAKADGPYRKPIAAPDPSGLLYGHHGDLIHMFREYDLFLSFKRALARTAGRAAGRSANTEQLQDQVDQLKLLVHGLISYLQAQPNFDFAQFQQ
jgi:hypothetical protein